MTTSIKALDGERGESAAQQIVPPDRVPLRVNWAFGLIIMKCRCDNLPDALYYEDASKAFFETLDEITTWNWAKLVKCRECGQYWSIDEWDKYQERGIIKILDPETWEALDSTEIRKRLLLKSRGGTENEKCIWAGCEGKQVKGVVLCIEHLFATGARK